MFKSEISGGQLKMEDLAKIRSNSVPTPLAAVTLGSVCVPEFLSYKTAMARY